MKLRDLLAGVPLTGGNADLNMEINSISYDSRTLEPGRPVCDALRVQDRRTPVCAQALEKGAAAVLCREPPRTGTWLSTPDPRAALARVSANLVRTPGGGDDPDRGHRHQREDHHHLSYQGHAGRGAEDQCGPDRHQPKPDRAVELPAHRTTPESYELQALLRRMADAGCTHVVMEAPPTPWSQTGWRD